MPQDGLFFRILRRFNLLLYAVIGLAVLAGCGYFGWNIVKTGSPLPLAYPVVASLPAATTTATYNVSIEAAETANGMPAASYYLFAMRRGAPTGLGELYGASDVVNLMDTDETGGGFWLFKGKDRNIILREAILEGELAKDATVDNRAFAGLLMWVVEKDTDKDGQLTASDGTALYYWRQGTRQAVKLHGAEQSMAGMQISGKRYNAWFKRGDKTISVLYSVPDFKQISETTLPDVPN